MTTNFSGKYNLLLKLPVADNCDVELLFRPIPLLAPLFRSCVDVSLFGDLWSICLPRRPSRPVSPTAVSLKLPSKMNKNIIECVLTTQLSISNAVHIQRRAKIWVITSKLTYSIF